MPDGILACLAPGKPGWESKPLDNEEYTADIDREETKWSTLIKSLGLKAE
jgi:tripartite-type tricarboxylate transporter receptor subunit TctC